MKNEIKELENKLKTLKQLEKSNKVFNSLTKSQKRVAIAKDVIASLRVKKYEARTGNYLAVENSIFNEESNPQLLVCDKDTKCSVCAIGAIFTSKVKVGNKYDGDLQDTDDYDMIANLKSIFGESELRYIEAAFEGDDITGEFEGDSKLNRAINFHDKYPDVTKRLTAIMENIIKNKGKFII